MSNALCPNGMTDTLTRKTVIDMRAYANTTNGYHPSRIHPCSHQFTVIQEDGTEFTIDAGQLAIFFKSASKCASMGEALDAVSRAWK